MVLTTCGYPTSHRCLPSPTCPQLSVLYAMPHKQCLISCLPALQTYMLVCCCPPANSVCFHRCLMTFFWSSLVSGNINKCSFLPALCLESGPWKPFLCIQHHKELLLLFMTWAWQEVSFSSQFTPCYPHIANYLGNIIPLNSIEVYKSLLKKEKLQRSLDGWTKSDFFQSTVNVCMYTPFWVLPCIFFN